MPVFTPSQQADSVHNTPAIVSVITADEISDMGVDSLHDVLNTVPGLEVIETTFGVYDVVFRGVLPGGVNDKSLLMINGHPIREFEEGSYFLEAIPITSVSQIEIVRGPGSVQYGTNAFAGVINVVTKSGRDSYANRIYVQYGTYKTADIAASGGVVQGDLSVFVAAQHHGGDGYPIAMLDTSGGVNKLRNRNNYDNAYVRLDWKGFEINGGYFTDNKTLPGVGFPQLDNHGYQWRESAFLDLRYQRSFSEAISVSLMLLGDGWWKHVDTATYPSPLLGAAPVAEGLPYSGSRWEAEGRANWQIVRWVKASGGVSYTLNVHDKLTDPAALIGFGREADTAVFGELFVSPFDKLGLNAGVRYNYNSVSGGFAVPRAGAVFSVSRDLSLKLLYGQAYRLPSFQERYHSVVGGDFPDLRTTPPYDPIGPTYILKPEKITTVEIGADWKLRKQALRVNAFYLTTTDVISLSRPSVFIYPLSPVPLPTVRYGNTPGYRIAGGEAELRGYPSDVFYYFLNVSVKYGWDNDSKKLPWLTPITANIGATYTFPKALRLKLSTHATLFGQRACPTNPFRNTSAFPNDSLRTDAYVIWNANLSYSLGHNVQISVLVNNILNGKFYYIEYINATGPQVPGMPFSAAGRLTLQF